MEIDIYELLEKHLDILGYNYLDIEFLEPKHYNILLFKQDGAYHLWVGTHPIHGFNPEEEHEFETKDQLYEKVKKFLEDHVVLSIRTNPIVFIKTF